VKISLNFTATELTATIWLGLRLASVDNSPVAVIGHQKGRTVHENMERNFAMAHPEGYRKAMRLMKTAEKFNRPIITFIDTSGAYPE
jgi:acetyl-CoA carboxylase carboxyl transferase subunit alpha